MAIGQNEAISDTRELQLSPAYVRAHTRLSIFSTALLACIYKHEERHYVSRIWAVHMYTWSYVRRRTATDVNQQCGFLSIVDREIYTALYMHGQCILRVCCVIKSTHNYCIIKRIYIYVINRFALKSKQSENLQFSCFAFYSEFIITLAQKSLDVIYTILKSVTIIIYNIIIHNIKILITLC